MCTVCVSDGGHNEGHVVSICILTCLRALFLIFFHVPPFIIQTRQRAWAEVSMGWVYSAPSFCTGGVRIQPVGSTRPASGFQGAGDLILKHVELKLYWKLYSAYQETS